MDETTPTSATAIERARDSFGSAAKLAAAIGKSPQFVSQMLSGEKRVPAELCPLIERGTAGAVKCEELRPDVAWSVLREQVA